MPYTLNEALGLSVSGIIIVMIALSILAVIVYIMGKIMDLTKKKNPVEAVSAKEIIDEVSLFDVDDKTAAMIMAIVADETQIPINELYFKSIKER